MQPLKELVMPLHPQKKDFTFVDTLYAVSEKNIILVAMLSPVITYVLFSTFGAAILLWNALLLLLLGYRYYNNIKFKKEKQKYKPQKWYQDFTLGALATAVLFSIMGIATLLIDPSTKDHLFILVLLLTFSSSASAFFSIDSRLSLLYSCIINLPLVLGLLAHGTKLYLFTAVTLFIYIVSKIYLTVQKLRQEEEIRHTHIQIEKVTRALKTKDDLIYAFFQSAPMAMFSYDKNLKITDANNALLTLFDSSRKEVVGLDAASLPDKQIPPILRKALLFGSQIYRGIYHSRKGKTLWVELTCFPLTNEGGAIEGAVGMIQDKTKEHIALTDLDFNARHDHLTSLLNRRGLKAYMETFVQQKEHGEYYSILFYLDLDKFKHINDSLGHKTGDELLVSIAKRLQNLSKDHCIVSRFGGDEFILFLPFVTKRALALKTKTKTCIKKIKDIFSMPFVLDMINLTIQTSIGIVVIKPGETDMEEVIRHADIAMYQAKKNPHERTSYYSAELDQERKELFLLQHDLAFAVEQKQLELHLQPLVCIEDDRLIAAECLIRWKHPRHGLLQPDKFIIAAIETGAISVITWWLIEEVCRRISKLKERGRWQLKYISVNVDAKQLLVDHLVDKLLYILRKYHVKSSELVIEITEQSLIDNFEETQQIITHLKNEGIHCAIDDFGIGYSSLSYLKKLSFDILKIDKEFIKDIQDKPDDLMLIRTMLDIGRGLGYTIIVEGIEHTKQKEALRRIDQSLIYQGYLFEKPIAFDHFVQKYLEV